MAISYRISSYVMPTEAEQKAILEEAAEHGIEADDVVMGDYATDDLVHATTGDGYVAYALFQGLMEDHPDRVYTIEAYVDGISEDYAVPHKEENGEAYSLLAHVTGTASEEELDVVTFDTDHPDTEAALSGIGIALQ